MLQTPIETPIPDLGDITVTAHDAPDDNGDRIIVQWADPGYQNTEEFTTFEISRSLFGLDSFAVIGNAAFGDTSFMDEKAATGGPVLLQGFSRDWC
ncbi:MAG: hypothetical protein IPH59_10440 [bacterium]|nr:hypothetical protein [bacterium]